MMTIDKFIQGLEPSISRDRLEAYRPLGQDDRCMIVTYLHNVQMSEALYTPLGFLEIALRNTLHGSITTALGNPAWYDLPGLLERNDQKSVIEAKNRISGKGKTPTPARVVSELHFGFWVSLLSSPYDTKLWRPYSYRALKQAFPRVPRSFRQRQTIYKRYNELRKLRNRVFHHETIWNRATLLRDYSDLCEAVGWISPAMAHACSLMDRFPDVHANGFARIDDMLSKSGVDS